MTPLYTDQRLVINPPLLPDESLQSYLSRLAKHNAYPTGEYVLRLIGRDVRPYTIDWFDRLSSLTGRSALDLHNATPHRFAELLAKRDSGPTSVTLPPSQEVTILGRAMRGEYFRPAHAVTCCPRCLCESEGYHRLSWLPRLAACCPIHGCLLIDRCNVCENEIGIDDITSGRCRKCGRRLADISTVDLNEDELGLAANRLLDSCWQGYLDAGLSERFALPDVPTTVLFELIIGLVRAVTYIGGDFKLLHRCGPSDQLGVEYIRRGNSPSQAFSLVATAFKAVRDWPMGFEDFLETYRSHSRDRSSGQVRADFGFFYTRILEQYWDTPEMEFAQKAFYRYVAATYLPSSSVTTLRRYRSDPWFRSQFPYVSISQAAERLKTTEREVQLLAQRGQISAVKVSGRWSGQWLISKCQVDSLREAWNSGISVGAIADQNNASEYDILDLATTGFLTILKDREEDQSVREVIVDGRRYTKLQGDLHTSADSQIARLPTITLAIAAKRLWREGYGVAKVVRRMLTGEIRYAKYGPGLLDVVLVAEDVESINRQVVVESRMLPLEQFEKRHRLKPLVVIRLLESGILEYLEDDEYGLWISEEAWKKFRYDYLQATEAARFLGCSTACVYAWTSRGFLKPVKFQESSVKMPYLYPREALVTLRNAHKMSLAQIEARFKVSREKIISLVDQGKIRTINETETPDLKAMRFLRADIEPLVKNLLKQSNSQ